MPPSDSTVPIPGDHPIVVLHIIAGEIDHDQWWSLPVRRTVVLEPMPLDERLSAAQCDASPMAERRRALIALLGRLLDVHGVTP